MQKSSWVISDKTGAKAAFTQAYYRCKETVLMNDDCNIVLELRPQNRSDQANRRLHAMLSTIASKCRFGGRKLTIEQVKLLMVSGHSIATNMGSDLVIGLEGEQVNMRESTAKMSVARMSSLMQYIEAWCALNDVEV